MELGRTQRAAACHFAAGTDHGFWEEMMPQLFPWRRDLFQGWAFCLNTVTSLVCLPTLFSRGRAGYAVQTCRVHTRHGDVNNGAETDGPRGSFFLKQNIFLDTRLGRRQHPMFVVLLIRVCRCNTTRAATGGWGGGGGGGGASGLLVHADAWECVKGQRWQCSAKDPWPSAHTRTAAATWGSWHLPWLPESSAFLLYLLFLPGGRWGGGWGGGGIRTWPCSLVNHLQLRERCGGGGGGGLCATLLPSRRFVNTRSYP